MKHLQLNKTQFRLSDKLCLQIDNLVINEGDSWAFVGSNGSGKTALANALCQEGILLSGEFINTFSRPISLSFEKLQKMIEEEWRRNNTDLLSEGEEDTGLTVAQVIQMQVKDDDRCFLLAKQFGIEYLLSRRFKYLSTGESRKVLLIQLLMNKPDLIILDEPFDGLDVDSRRALNELLTLLHQQNLTIILILNRFNDIPDFIQYAGLLINCELVANGEKEQVLSDSVIGQLSHSETLENLTLPEQDLPDAIPQLSPTLSPIVLKNGVVSYNDKPVLHHLSWEVKPQQHWQIIGPNGAGKSTLLSLITGDHPQGYSNDLTLFGRKRGSGETIWEIKRHIGYVSNALHQSYRVSSTVKNVIISGFHDSIGIYQAITDKQLKLADEWLALMGLTNYANSPFHALSWGQQRLVLIVRALVKHPTLLILDEPLQGLDTTNRLLIQRFIDIMISHSNTQLLFVSHHQEDAPSCITHRLTFIKEGEIYRYQQEIC
ncbi:MULTISPECIES: molybdate ABC transporter ATP-binding protein ModF [Proteus]|uniref:molybdate ABC transporter ATP-binding protein ModF n=1 Tax=Proteus TaxID=583 RepID=UPI00137673A0|nr:MULTISPECIES: molybdate ABC transporter ATP-binding protein ModF [Proteus]MCO8050303.1 molybdate ABC transporter ATP-binding protein ModF [Proteus penneri]MCX2586671.1 molybdate ABC transporter ATP-binding protein ModF [Proteus penneri]NBL79265.1 molybdate ABC transporter ATP-binding protein ModF [Proteus sp. G2672]NBL90822.1 molybdate ABC transporter ATP-binding protein ModF [Proteus sp. G2673]NBM03648.1 molybdate ABC transporter ATP-binding protein ModF [Proteus sp. G2671]